MTKGAYVTATGREIADDEVDAIAAAVEGAAYDVAALRRRKRGRPSMGSEPARVLPVRLDPELRAALETRAREEETTLSEVIRQALRRHLGAT